MYEVIFFDEHPTMAEDCKVRVYPPYLLIASSVVSTKRYVFNAEHPE